MDKGKVALVTGGSRGIGAALAKALAARGPMSASPFSLGARQGSALAELGVRAHAFRADQADPAASAPLIASVMEHFGNLDILVNNAGISTLQEVGSETDIPALDRI